jgi:hypothetical protein
MNDTTDYKQLAFKLQSDIEYEVWEKATNDKSFLTEIKSYIQKYEQDKDVASLEMAYKMIDDWIFELNEQSK